MRSTRCEPAPGPADAERLTGESGPIRRIRAQLQRLAPLDTTVLITGETGVGKGLCARMLHRLSARPGPFVQVDCAALAPTLLESELFGHERGAFTGAASRRIGRLERAAGGTLFLDEIGELEPAQQARLLGFLQERRFERVGGGRSLRLDARIVAATSRDLADEVHSGRFRADLYYRLAVVRIELPPLRSRPADVQLLAREGLAAIAERLGLPAPRLETEAAAALAERAWRGNVRELFNALERLTIHCPGERVTRDQLEWALGRELEPERGAVFGSAAAERTRIAAALREADGNVARAARSLGIPRTTLRRRIARASARRESRSVAEKPDELEQNEPQCDQREHALVEAREPALRHVPEDPAADPGSGHHRGGQDQQRRKEAGERETRDAEHGELRQVAQRLASGLRADDPLPGETEVQEEGSEQRTRRADGGIQQADHSAQYEEAAAAVAAFRVQARRQHPRDPGRQQHEDADQRAGQ